MIIMKKRPGMTHLWENYYILISGQLGKLGWAALFLERPSDELLLLLL